MAPVDSMSSDDAESDSSATSDEGSTIETDREDPMLGRGKPQLDASNKARYAEHWGISHSQLRDLLHSLYDDPTWDPETNMYDFVEHYVKERTRGTGRGLALELNQDAPLEVNKMVSHCWSENVEDFLEQVLKSTHSNDVLFICAFGIYQCEDNAGPSIEEQIGEQPSQSPFARVLGNIAGRRRYWNRWALNLKRMFSFFLLLGFVLLCAYPTVKARYPGGSGECSGLEYSTTPFSSGTFNCTGGRHQLCARLVSGPCPSIAFHLHHAGRGCQFLALVILLAFFYVRRSEGDMLVVPTPQTEVYSRLWCVYEIFYAHVVLKLDVRLVRSLTPVGSCKSEEAKCTQRKDEERITNDILGPKGGFGRVDAAVRLVTRRADRRIMMQFFGLFCLGACGMPHVMRVVGASWWTATVIFCTWSSLWAIGGVILFRIIMPAQGLLTLRQIRLAVSLLIVVCVSMSIVAVCLLTVRHILGVNATALGFGLFAISGTVVVGFVVYFCTFSQQGWARPIMLPIAICSWIVHLHVLCKIMYDLSPIWYGKAAFLIMQLPELVEATFTVLDTTCVVCVAYMPYLMLMYHVRQSGVKGSLRSHRPQKGRRLVFTWERRFFLRIPWRALPAKLPVDLAPPQLEALGLDNGDWQRYVESLRRLQRAAWRSPRMWLWFAFELLDVGVYVGFPICYPLIWALRYVASPSLDRCCNVYQKGVAQWVKEFNQELELLNVCVKVQTVTKGFSEVSYIVFAFREEEIELLRKEDSVMFGESLNRRYRSPWEFHRMLSGRVL